MSDHEGIHINKSPPHNKKKPAMMKQRHSKLLLGMVVVVAMLTFWQTGVTRSLVSTTEKSPKTILKPVAQTDDDGTTASPRISYEYLSGRTVRTRDPNYSCGLPEEPRISNRIPRRHWNSFMDHVPIATTITTELDVIVMGDSVGAQMYFMMQNAMENINNSTPPTNLYLVKERHPQLQFDKSVRGRGSLSYWRITDLWYPDKDQLPLPSKPNGFVGGWQRSHVQQLLSGLEKTKLDALVYRIPNGWISPVNVTLEGLQSTVHMAREMLNVSKIIFTPSILNNNIRTEEELNEMLESNKRLRQFAKSNPDVFVLDLDTLLHSLIRRNAYELHMTNETDDLTTPLDWTKSALNWTIQNKHPHRAAQVCGKEPESYFSRKLGQDAYGCERNYISFDGMHLCPELVSGRFSAGVACLLGCAFEEENQELAEHYSCEESCNRRFMRPFTPDDIGSHLSADLTQEE